MVSTCHRCGRSIDAAADFIEHQEVLIISFRAGYGSLFGDGNLVESALCQNCVNTLLGPWLRITADDPFEPRHPLRYLPQRAYQPNQLPRPEAIRTLSDSELKQLFSNMNKDDT
ncbi:MAG TPA: hypothetical protein VJ654_11275 [Noviherbaspirillum sp.]|nr:hypothetical protein [Noviherbaspirillum sp.]